jgi:hypothetical protein
MKKRYILLLAVFTIGVINAQTTNPIIIPLADTQYIQTCHVITQSNEIYVTGSYVNYPTEYFYKSGVEVFQLNQNLAIQHKYNLIPPSENEQFYQMLSNSPLQISGNNLYVSSSFKTSDWTDNAMVTVFDKNNLGITKQNKIRQEFGITANTIAKYKENGHVFLAGLLAGNSANPWPARIYEMDQNGDIIDSISFDLPSSVSSREYLDISDAQFIDSNLIIYASFFEFEATDPATWNTIISISPSGSINWFKEYASGRFTANDTSKKIYFSNINKIGNLDQWCLSIYDKNGNFMEQKCHTEASSLTSLGSAALFSDQLGNVYLVGAKSFLSWVAKMDANGDIIWERIIQENTLGDDYKLGVYSGTIDDNNNVFLSGGLNGPQGSNFEINKHNYWVMKMNSEGCYGNICTDTLVVMSTVISKTEDNLDKPVFAAAIYPNPANGHVHISLDEKTPFFLTIFNILGQRQLEDTNPASSIDINTQHWPEGIYWIFLQDQTKGIIAKTPLIITH